MTDTDTGRSDLLLLMTIFLNGLRLIYQLHMLKKQLRNGEIMKENLDVSSAVRTLLILDRYVSEFINRLKKRR